MICAGLSSIGSTMSEEVQPIDGATGSDVTGERKIVDVSLLIDTQSEPQAVHSGCAERIPQLDSAR